MEATKMVELRSWRRVRISLVREKSERPYTMRSGADVARLAREFVGDDPREQFLAIYLDTRHRPIAVHGVSVGTADGAPVSPREVFGPALQLAATALVVAHNHPSGDPTPSAEDLVVTDRLRAAGEMLGVQLLDHVVIGEAAYHSIVEGATFRW